MTWVPDLLGIFMAGGLEDICVLFALSFKYQSPEQELAFKSK